ncbi:hypothetical protein [Pseudalkalibacillus sp. SCS-8]|uniref:hypothetical protein n=1 Tax=Pseudalkalibacillus nanhaiensis TaxID=3115291 RepID=UPI0032DAD321
MRFLMVVIFSIIFLIGIIIGVSGRSLTNLFDYGSYWTKTAEAIELQGYFAVHIGIPMLTVLLFVSILVLVFLKVTE